MIPYRLHTQFSQTGDFTSTKDPERHPVEECANRSTLQGIFLPAVNYATERRQTTVSHGSRFHLSDLASKETRVGLSNRWQLAICSSSLRSFSPQAVGAKRRSRAQSPPPFQGGPTQEIQGGGFELPSDVELPGDSAPPLTPPQKGEGDYCGVHAGELERHFAPYVAGGTDSRPELTR
jgi:hypothetical protein